MGRKIVHISLPDEIYFKFKEMAQKEHLKLSTWLKQRILRILNKGAEKVGNK